MAANPNLKRKAKVVLRWNITGTLLHASEVKAQENPSQEDSKIIKKHAGLVVYGNIQRKRIKLKIKNEGKEDHSHSQQTKLNNFTDILWGNRHDVRNPISTANMHNEAIICID